MSYKHLCLASSLACLLVCFPDAASSSADIQTLKSLYRDKLDDYDTRIRPLKNQSAAIYINTKFVPQSLLEFDTSEQKFSMLGYFRIAWRDEVLIWNPDNYTGIRVLNVPIEQMWKPSIIILKVSDCLFACVCV
ncbi:hypothetical protein DPMN_115844 [Dreissena polymorpha]|uniref:Neurotransmitter-gated ion-channel ligand-binding domain-containing protein n=1 Tax=Dreissena polymorpha TaxID=45954 RepID=A0A9D4KLY7_DREPO|nr:hypothetical protein DPMN_115844 [Dreissena polymorpha]